MTTLMNDKLALCTPTRLSPDLFNSDGSTVSLVSTRTAGRLSSELFHSDRSTSSQVSASWNFPTYHLTDESKAPVQMDSIMPSLWEEDMLKMPTLDVLPQEAEQQRRARGKSAGHSPRHVHSREAAKQPPRRCRSLDCRCTLVESTKGRDISPCARATKKSDTQCRTKTLVGDEWGPYLIEAFFRPPELDSEDGESIVEGESMTERLFIDSEEREERIAQRKSVLLSLLPPQASEAVMASTTEVA